MKNNAILILIIALGFFLRFWGLGQAPVALNWDEASLGYNAYSILKTGKDEWGNFLPTIFPAFGDYKLPGYVYASIIPISVFGLSSFSIRFISALSGTFAIFGVYLLSNKIFSASKISFTHKNFTAAHLSALILALLPWHIFLSRPALEANLGLTLFLFGLYFLISSLEKTTHLIYASLLMGLAMHTYNSYRVLVPITAVVFLVTYVKKINYKSFSFLLSLVIAVIASVVLLNQIRTGQGLARYQKLKILNPNVVYQIGESRANSNLHPLISKLIHNRPVYFMTAVAKNYLSYFSFTFWNQSKGAQYQFAIPGQSLVTYPVLIFLIVGVFYSVFVLRSKEISFPLSIFLLSPVAASLTNDPPQAIRPSPMIIFSCLFAVVGIFALQVYFKKKKELLLCIFISLFALSAALYLNNYWTSYQVQYSSSWQFGYQQMYQYVSSVSDNYEKIFITKRYGEPHIFSLFYNKTNPSVLQDTKKSIRFEKSNWLWTDKIEDTYFLNDWQIPSGEMATSFVLESGDKISSKNSLLVTSPEHIPTNSSPLKTINFLDGSPAFIIVSIQ